MPDHDGGTALALGVAVGGVEMPGQQLVIWTAESGTPSHDGLRIRVSWSAGADRSAAEQQGFGA
ncbi:hypothetical protein ACIBK8_24415 [Streptomyces sp. NPDC050161]|uniref:hypothetical protein n=1 Tax=Streptomyces sp. NPDC050161 TaxID=3365604 RepID=UPI0037A8CBD7